MQKGQLPCHRPTVQRDSALQAGINGLVCLQLLVLSGLLLARRRWPQSAASRPTALLRRPTGRGEAEFLLATAAKPGIDPGRLAAWENTVRAHGWSERSRSRLLGQGAIHSAGSPASSWFQPGQSIADPLTCKAALPGPAVPGLLGSVSPLLVSAHISLRLSRGWPSPKS